MFPDPEQGTEAKPTTLKRPLVAVGSCVVGEPVRFNGEHKRSNSHVDRLSAFVDMVPICPEVGIGLGVPRETIRLVDVDGSTRARDSKTQQQDVTERLQNYADQQQQIFPDLCGYIFVKGSPSCGLFRVNRYNPEGHVIAADSAGVYARRILDADPLLPVEEDGRLHDNGLRESFVSRVYLYYRWRNLLAAGLTAGKLREFYADYKYLIMAHSVPAYKQLGPLLADAKNRSLQDLADEVIALMMTALKQVPTRGGQVNVLQHIQGYLKRKLSAEEKRSLEVLIEQYRNGIIPLVAPMTLLKHHFAHSPDPYIERQLFMQPYPEELALRSYL